MRKNTLLTVFGLSLILLFLSSCGDKNDRLLDKYEKLVKKSIEINKAVSNGDLSKAAELDELAKEGQEIEKELDIDKLSAEQKKRFEQIIQDATAEVQGSLKDLNNLDESTQDPFEGLSDSEEE